MVDQQREVQQIAAPLAAALCRWLAISALGLALANAAGRWSYRVASSVSADVRDIFDMSLETSLATWLSITVFLLLGGCCFGLGRLRRRSAFYAGGVLFVYLSADDGAMLHERLGRVLHPYFDTGPVFVWVVVLAPLFVVAGLLVVVLFWEAAGAGRGHRRLLVAGSIAMAAALGIEAMEGVVVDAEIRWRGLPLERYTGVLEEFLELLGPILWLRVFGGLLESDFRRVSGPPSRDVELAEPRRTHLDQLAVGVTARASARAGSPGSRARRPLGPDAQKRGPRPR